MNPRFLFPALAALVLALPAHGMSKKPALTVRFHTEANARDGNSFAMPVKLFYQRKEVYLNRVPDFSEKQIALIYPFQTQDGTWGCVFQLNAVGRIRLETLSNESRGAALVVFVGTKGGQHQVIDMVIDRTVSDGMITIPRGLTALEIAVMQKEFKSIGSEVKGGTPAKKDEGNDWMIDRSRDELKGRSAPAPAPIKRQGSPEPDLPRLAD